MIMSGLWGANRDVQTMSQTATAPQLSATPISAPQFREVRSFTDDLEVIIANIECRLLESLTPRQFEMVQHLVEASRLLTEAELTMEQQPVAKRMSA
jgi:hypothetical protein